jgi:predicted DNA-binding protein YlxM (UPF0122 family)
MNAHSRISPVYSMNEAAALLKICRRALQDLIKDHPFYYLNGRRKLFMEKDVEALRAVMYRKAEEETGKCRSNLSRRTLKGGARSIPCGERISGSVWTEAQRRLRALSQANSSRPGAATSNVRPFPAPGSRRS